MAKILIVYHSQSGNTEKMAHAVYDGAVSSGATVSMKKAPETTAQDLLEHDIIIMGTANYFNREAGIMKDLFDRTFFDLKGKVDHKPYATFGSAGNGGDRGLNSLNALCDNLGLKKATDSVLAYREPTDEVISACKGLGGKMAIL